MTECVLLTTAPGKVALLSECARLFKQKDRPFRVPHHTASLGGMVQELALAAGGVLYLDDVLEFSPRTLHTVRNLWQRMDVRVRPVLVLGMRFQRPEWVSVFLSTNDWRVIRALPRIDRHIIAGGELDEH